MDDETRKRFDVLDETVDRLATVIGDKFERLDGQLNAIVTRLDEQDSSHDRLMAKVDRLFVKVDQLSVLSSAGEEAMTSLDALSLRVAKLEAAQRGIEE